MRRFASKETAHSQHQACLEHGNLSLGVDFADRKKHFYCLRGKTAEKICFLKNIVSTVLIFFILMLAERIVP